MPSHQWVNLTDAGGEFGATILTDCKNASDKREQAGLFAVVQHNDAGEKVPYA